jgi:hypothetical protein
MPATVTCGLTCAGVAGTIALGGNYASCTGSGTVAEIEPPKAAR